MKNDLYNDGEILTITLCARHVAPVVSLVKSAPLLFFEKFNRAGKAAPARYFEPQSREGRKGFYLFPDRGSQSGKEPCPAGQAIGIEDCRLKIEKQRKY